MTRPSRQAGAAGNPRLSTLAVLLAALAPGITLGGDGSDTRFDERVLPVLEEHCYSCHGNGIKKGQGQSALLCNLGKM